MAILALLRSAEDLDCPIGEVNLRIHAQRRAIGFRLQSDCLGSGLSSFVRRTVRFIRDIGPGDFVRQWTSPALLLENIKKDTPVSFYRLRRLEIGGRAASRRMGHERDVSLAMRLRNRNRAMRKILRCRVVLPGGRALPRASRGISGVMSLLRSRASCRDCSRRGVFLSPSVRFESV